MKKFIAMVLCLVLAVTIVGCGKITYRIGITIPSDSTDDFVWSDEEISPNGRKITIYSCDELGDAEIILKPIEVKEENAYDEPVVIARGKSLTLNAEKGAWFKIGIRMLNNAVPGKVKYFEIKDIEVRISSEDVTAQENSVMHGRILEIADGNLSIEAGGKNYIVYDWMEYIPTGPSFEIGDEVEITYNGITSEENPSGLCGVSKIDLTHDEYIRKYGNEGNDEPLWDYPPMVMVNGELYIDTGKKSTVDGRCGNMDGQITSSVPQTEMPTENNQSNFGTGFGYQYGPTEGTIEIYINDTWWVYATEKIRNN